MNLKERRAAAGLTQARLAEKSGMNIRQIQRIEKGEIVLENVTLKNAVGLAKALGITAEQLLGEPEPERMTEEEKQFVERVVMDWIRDLEEEKERTEKLLNKGLYSEELELNNVQLEREIVTLWAALKKL